MLTVKFVNADAEVIDGVFSNMMSSPAILVTFMLITMIITVSTCSVGLQNGVERVTKVIMILLILIMIILGINSLLLLGVKEGVKFYLMPSVENVASVGLGNVIYGALNQSFFTLSLGMGGMLIFGSYIDKKRSLAGEAYLNC